MESKKQTAVEELAKEFYSDENQLMERIAFKRGYTECEEALKIENDKQEHDIRFAYMAGFNRGLDNNPNHLEEYIEYIKTLEL